LNNDPGESYSVNVNIMDLDVPETLYDVDVRTGLTYGVEHAFPVNLPNMGFSIASFDDLLFEINDEADQTCRTSVMERRPATLGFQDVMNTDGAGTEISTCLELTPGVLTYNLEGELVVGDGAIPPNSKIEIYFEEVNSGVTNSQYYPAPPENTLPATIPFLFTNLDCDGDSYTIRARFVEDDGGAMPELEDPCNGFTTSDEPCWLDITILNIIDECRTTGTYTVQVIGTYYNAPGNMTVEITGNGGGAFTPATQTLTLTALADGENVVLREFTKDCDGQLHDVNASFAGIAACSDMDAFEGPRDRDYGDNPDGFDTNFASGGAFHIIHPDIYLGDCVDSELDGAPEAQAGVDGTPAAGSGTGGDDAAGVEFEPGEMFYHECVDDDEDGVRFITPMVQGNEACVEVTATSTLGAATLDMWVDFNGDGTFQAGEKVAFTSNVVPAGTSTQQYCFTVPATATFPNQETHVRVRLSTAGVANPTGVAFDGEVEDYYIEFAKIGDYVWEDLDLDGFQEAGEPPIGGSEVTINGFDILGNPYTATVNTTAAGMYMFNGLLPGDYSLDFGTPAGFFPTPQDNVPGNDVDDSDASEVDGTTIVYTLGPGDINPDVDAGFWTYASIGDYVWKDQDADGFQDPSEPGIPGVTVMIEAIGGVDFLGNSFTPQTMMTDGSGLYLFDDLVPGEYKITFTTPGGMYTTVLNNVPGNDADDSDADETMGGMTAVETLLSSEDNRDYDAGFWDPVGVGDIVWIDDNGNGQQDNVGMPGGEVPVVGATVTLFYGDGTGPVIDANGATVGTQPTDGNGMYMFGDLVPGDYIVRVDPNLMGYVTTFGGVDPDDDASNTDSNGADIGGGVVQSPAITLHSDQEINDGDVNDLHPLDDKNPSVDFGFYEPVRVGDLVWEDLDGDGIQDANEPGVEGVTVMLLGYGPDGLPNTADDIMATTTTLADGSYIFEDNPDTATPNDLPPGTYKVKFSDLPAGFVFTNPNLGDQVNNDDEDSDAVLMSAPNDPPVAMTQTVTLASGEEDLDLDAGIIEPVRVGDYVWEDLNGDGLQDANEPGVGGITVMLIGFGPDGIENTADDIMATTTTAADGSYLFTDDPATDVPNDLPPGTYKVKFSDLPLGSVFTDSNQGDPVNDDDIDSDAVLMSAPNDPPVAMSQTTTIPSGEEDLTLDAGIISPVSVGDYVWEDLDGDGLQDPNEPGVGGVMVMLIGFGPDGIENTPDDIMAMTTTAADGSYLFEDDPSTPEPNDLPPGMYKVKFSDLPAGFVFTNPNLGDPVNDDDEDSDAVLMSGPNDPPVAMSQVVDVPSGTQNLTLDAGIVEPVSVGDYVWEDLDGDGIQDANEPGVGGVTVMLIGFGPDGIEGTADDIMATTTTAGDGSYLFTDDPATAIPNDLPPGTYKVKFSDLPGNLVFTNPNLGDPVDDDDVDSDAVLMSDPNDPPVAMTQPSFIPSGEEDLDLDAGVIEPVRVGDYVWEDLDGDGLQDPGEPGVGNVTVMLIGFGPDGIEGTGDDIMATTTTASDGSYLFTDDPATDVPNDLPPGTYKVKFSDLPAGFVFTNPNLGDPVNDDDEDSDAVLMSNPADPPVAMSQTTFIPSGEEDLTLDAGIIEPVRVGDYVWEDLNGDGFQDPNEPGAGGVTVMLIGFGPDGIEGTADDIMATTTTASDGSYLFTDDPATDVPNDLPPGTYKVKFSDLPDGLVFTDANQGNPISDDDIDSDAVLMSDPADPPVAMTQPSTIPSGEEDLTLDAGIVGPVSVGDYVWEDLDGDGIQDPNEPGVGGVTVMLIGFGPDGIEGTGDDIMDVTTTAGDGSYLFEDDPSTDTPNDLPPGMYKVKFSDLPPGFIFTNPNLGDQVNEDDVDSDAVLMSGPSDPPVAMSQVVDIPSGTENLTLDAGIVEPVSVGDYVWEDLDGDGIQDPNESGVGGVTVMLIGFGPDGIEGTSDDIMAMTTTAADGSYLFEDDPSTPIPNDLPPGTYKVKFSDLPDGFVFTYPNLGDQVNDDDEDSDAVLMSNPNDPPVAMTQPSFIPSGEEDLDLDAGIIEPVRVGDYVWEDLDGDGIQDPNEPGVEDVTVMLIGFGPDGIEGTGDDIMATTTTAADGSYIFEDDPATAVPNDLPPGTYKVKFSDLPAGFVFTNPNLGDQVNNDDEDSDAVLMSDPNDPPVAMSHTSFIPSGEEDLTLDAGIIEPVRVGDYVWEDLDGDGIQDANEPGVGGVTVMLLGFGPDGIENTADDIMATTTTAGDGSYLFTDDPATAVPNDLPPGTYKVKFSDLPNGFVFTYANLGDQVNNDDEDSDAVLMSNPNDPPVAMSHTTTIPSGEEDLTLDAGIFDPVRVGDYVWEDVNGNGLQDDGNTGVNGVLVMLTGFGPDGIEGTGDDIMEMTTTMNSPTGQPGWYLFEDDSSTPVPNDLPPGTYKVKFSDLPGDFVFTFPNEGDPVNDDDEDSDAVLMSDPNDPPVAMTQTTFIPSQEEDLTLDAGIYEPASISDYTWIDVDGDGIQDPTEPPLGGVKVTLTGTAGNGSPVIDPATGMDYMVFTEPDGSYIFDDLPPGDYKLTFMAPNGSEFLLTYEGEGTDETADSDADPGMGGMTETTTLISGEDDETWDAGFYEPASIGDYVWDDQNNNGQQDPGELPIEGVKVTLTGTTGNGTTVLDPATGMEFMTFTEPDGSYLFDGLVPGDYKLTFDTPADLNPTKANEPGVNDTDDSDADPNTGMTEFTFLESGEYDPTWDAGFFAIDFGDLPDSYGTTDAATGPKHIIIPQLYLGSCVDAETDGQDEAMAGLMDNGDDNNASSYGQPGSMGCADDEDGITFITPVIPGYEACIEIDVVNTTGAPAVLQGWLDFDGNYVMDDPADELTTGDFAGGGVTIPNGGVTDLEVCFDIPADAMYVMGDGFMRFRLSPAGGLEATGVNPDGTLPAGEVEDYKLPDVKIGNLIWEDRNYNGIQDPGIDDGINGIRVELMWAGPNGNFGDGDDETYVTVSAPVTYVGMGPGGSDLVKDGIYYFEGLTPGEYKITVVTNRFATLQDVGGNVGDADVYDSDNENGEFFTILPEDITNQILDEDGLYDMPGMTNAENPGNSYPDAQDNLSFDFGYVGFDRGDLPQSFVTLENDPAMPGMEGPRHLATPLWYMGACLDVDLYGQPDYTAGYYDALDPNNPEPAMEGDDNILGVVTLPVGVNCGDDDENGVILKTDLVPGYEACFDVNTTAPEAGVMQAWIDFDGSLDFNADGSEAIVWTSTGTTEAAIAAGADVTTELCFMVPDNAVIFPNLETHMRFRFSDQGGLDSKNPYANGDFPFGEVEDYYQPLAELGDYVWHDVNGNGVQDDGEAPIEGVTVELHDCTDPANPVLIATTTTDGVGFYEFIGLIPMKKYCVYFDVTTSNDPNADDYVFTFEDSPLGDETNNNDADAQGWTDPVMMDDRERDETVDAGVYVPASLGNYVWLDYDEDGEQDPDEPVVVGAKLFLSGTNNIGGDIPGPNMVPAGQPDPVTMLMTDENGEYLFTGLAPGTYKVTFDVSMITAPAELERFAQLLVFTFQDNIPDDTSDSDVDPGDYDSPIGMSGFYDLLSGDEDLTVDAGVMVPCLPPTDIFVDMVMETTAIIHWTVNNEIFDINTNAHCWNIAIGNNGFEPWMNEAVQLIMVCADDPNIVIDGDQVSYMVEGLQPGTCYDVYVQEGCNGEVPPSATHGWVNAPGTPQIGDILGNPLLSTDPDGLCTFDYPHIVTKSATAPDCPWGSENYVANGTLTVTIEDSPSCGPSTFTITVTPVAGSTPGGTTPVAVSDLYEDVPAGSYTYTDLDAGEYEISVLETGPCRPKVNPVVMTQEVPNAVDTDGPDKFVTDILGNEITDLGPFFLPEGACHYQLQLYVQAIDGCYGPIVAEDAVSTSIVMTPASVEPGSQALVTTDDFGNYLIDVNLASGTTELTITVEDPDGNPTSMTYVIEVFDLNDPEILMVGPNNVTIPHCEESVDVVVTVYVNDVCDQTVNPDNILFTANGTEQVTATGDGYVEYVVSVGINDDETIWSALYTDDMGNSAYADVQISVEQAVADMPALIYAEDDNQTIPYCEDEVVYCYSFQVYDDCAEVDVDEVLENFDDGGMNLTLDWVDASNPNFVYFAYCGPVAPGTYFPVISYDGQSVQPLVNINQQQNQAPVVNLPGNLNVTIPVCEESVSVTWAVQIYDDCDDVLDLENLQIFFDETFNDTGLPTDLAVNWINEPAGYFEFTGTFTADDDGVLLVVNYTDSDGLTTIVDAEINVTSQPDTWAPVLVYPSQDIDIELEACEDPLVEVCFYVTAYDNCDEDVTATVMMNGQALTAVSGNEYCVEVAPGEHQIDISATDASNNSSAESFTINVTQEESIPDNLACISNVQATLEGDCSVELLASTVLNGEFGCLTDEDFDIVVMDDNPDNGAIIDGCGTFGYMISLKAGVEGNFTVCWGEVTSEDKTSPEIDCPDPTDHSLTSGEAFICTDIDEIRIDGVQYYTAEANGTIVEGSLSAELAYILGETGYPTVSDNCGQLRIAVWDVVQENDCGDDVITRHFEVSDRYNSDCTGQPMTASCTQEIRVRKPDINDVDVPDDIVEVECSDDTPLTDEGYPHPSVTGYPSVTTAYGTYDLAATYCNLGAAFEDSAPIEVCASSYKIIRTWSIVDWCVVPAQVTEYEQIIKVGDTTPPVIGCNWEDTDWDGEVDMPVYSTGPFDCTATFPIAAPNVTDNCNTYQWYVDVVILTEGYTYDQWGQVTGTEVVEQVLSSFGPLGADEPGPYATNVPLSLNGNHYLHYTAIDECGNVSTYDCAFGVEDHINPVAVCDDELNISIGSEGHARVYAEDIDEGSNDNCELTHIEVRRAGGEWGEYVDFDCEDVHDFVVIELQVWDASGNSNICWLEVLIEDKINPYCHAPHTLACTVMMMNCTTSIGMMLHSWMKYSALHGQKTTVMQRQSRYL
jgi:hypothetical protein